MSISDCFFQFQQTKENSRCADCSTPSISHACVTFGVFICESCSEKHNSSLPETSLIKSLKDDTWTIYHINQMLTGGNKRFREFIANFDISPYCEISMKYSSDPAKQYQKLLKHESEYRRIYGFVSSYDEQNTERAEPQAEGSWWSGTKEMINRVVKKAVELGSNTKEKIRDSEVLSKFRVKADQILSKSVDFKEQVEEKVNKESLINFKNKSLEVIDTLSSITMNKVKTVYFKPCIQSETEMIEMGNPKSSTLS